jgi:hypothetical protein
MDTASGTCIARETFQKVLSSLEMTQALESPREEGIWAINEDRTG